MSIKTDSKMPDDKKDPDENNIYKIHKLFLNESEDKQLREKFLNSDKVAYSYKQAKEELFEAFINYFKEMKKKFDYYTTTSAGKKEVLSVMKDGAKKANKIASQKMKIVRKETGLDF